MSLETLLERHGITRVQFEDSKFSRDELSAIADDHKTREGDYRDVLDAVLRRLAKIPNVHSTRGRIKDFEHLMAKCIRKKSKYPDLSVENYRKYITDLVGVRALHLYKNDWISIHDELTSNWKESQPPKAYIRSGDDTSAYDDNLCETAIHEKNYRSVHYVLEVQVITVEAVVEIQVRTLFEEAWSEIDHQVRYPRDDVDPALEGFLNLFNRIAGASDEMGSYVGTLNARVTELEQAIAQAVQDRDESVNKLRVQINNLAKTTDEEKQKLVKEIELLRAPSGMETIAKIVGGVGAGILMAGAAASQSAHSQSTPSRGIRMKRPGRIVVSTAVPTSTKKPAKNE